MATENALEQVALDWAVRCFGQEHVYSRPMRSLRIAEEAVELMQALHVPKDKALNLVEMVYSRPIGDPRQELQGVALTLAVMCAALGFTVEDILRMEVLRVLGKPVEQFQQRNQEKLDLGFGL